jgi:NAD(P)H-nitrite reductase large subunit
MSKSIVIVGGGIAATTCLDTLVRDYCLDNARYSSITLISTSRLLKKAVNYELKGRNIETFDVTEVGIQDISNSIMVPEGLKVNFTLGYAKYINTVNKTVIVNRDELVEEHHYDILSICIGSSPKVLNVIGAEESIVKERLITIRDTDSVEALKLKLSSCRRVAIVGNGGISLELIYTITNCEKIWIVRDEFIGHPFLDSEASRFLINSIQKIESRESRSEMPQFRPSKLGDKATHGPALGPYWLQQQDLIGTHGSDDLKIIFNNNVDRIVGVEHDDWPLKLFLSDGQIIQCDLVVSAIGVLPNTINTFGDKLRTSEVDGGILIDEQMRSSICNVYAAGDVVSCEEWRSNTLWFQMRLWTQARQMGQYCARCITAHLAKADPTIYFNFDCFTHSTKFFGVKVLLLGHYNLQSEDERRNIEVLVRIRENQDYTKLVIKEDRVIGAILVGETGLDETIENLIHDQIEIGSIKHQILDDTVDIDDYFD